MTYGVHAVVGAKRRTRITSHGGISLPEDLLRKHHLKAGDEVAVEDTDRGIVITPQVGEEPMSTEYDPLLFAKPSPAEIARRRALFAQVMARRQVRDIRPLTSTELIHLARTAEGSMEGPGS